MLRKQSEAPARTRAPTGRAEKVHAGPEGFLVGDAFDAGDLIQGFDRHAGFGPAAVRAGASQVMAASSDQQREQLQGSFHREWLVKVKYKHLRRFHGGDGQRAFVADARGVTAGKLLAVEGDFAFGHMHPGMAVRGERVAHALPGSSLASSTIGVLMDGHGAVAAGLAGHQVQLARFGLREIVLGVPRRHAFGIRLDPDLQQARGLGA